jgi:hypothetical protein
MLSVALSIFFNAGVIIRERWIGSRDGRGLETNSTPRFLGLSSKEELKAGLRGGGKN